MTAPDPSARLAEIAEIVKLFPSRCPPDSGCYEAELLAIARRQMERAERADNWKKAADAMLADNEKLLERADAEAQAVLELTLAIAAYKERAERAEAEVKRLADCGDHTKCWKQLAVIIKERDAALAELAERKRYPGGGCAKCWADQRKAEADSARLRGALECPVCQAAPTRVQCGDCGTHLGKRVREALSPPPEAKCARCEAETRTAVGPGDCVTDAKGILHWSNCPALAGDGKGGSSDGARATETSSDTEVASAPAKPARPQPVICFEGKHFLTQDQITVPCDCPSKEAER